MRSLLCGRRESSWPIWSLMMLMKRFIWERVIVMDANPGRIVADIKIEEDFPRDRSSENFIAYRNMILNRLHFAGKKHE